MVESSYWLQSHRIPATIGQRKPELRVPYEYDEKAKKGELAYLAKEDKSTIKKRMVFDEKEGYSR